MVAAANWHATAAVNSHTVVMGWSTAAAGAVADSATLLGWASSRGLASILRALTDMCSPAHSSSGGGALLCTARS
jgi:hypothetical protein